MVKIPWELFFARAALAGLCLVSSLCASCLLVVGFSAMHGPSKLHFVWILSSAAISLFWVGTKKMHLALRHLESRRLRSAQAYIKESSCEHALILRPFGGDGSIILRKHRWVFSPRCMLEELIEEAVQREFQCECYSLVDSATGVITTGPQYLLSDGKYWKEQVDVLLRRSKVAFMVLPPGLSITGSVMWELMQLVELGFAGRIVFVLPPPKHPKYDSSLEAMSLALTLFAPGVQLSRQAHRPIIIYPEYDGKVKYWYAEKPKECGGWVYREAFAAALRKCAEVLPAGGNLPSIQLKSHFRVLRGGGKDRVKGSRG